MSWTDKLGQMIRSTGCRCLLDDAFGDLAHGSAAVHRRLLDPAERLRLGQPELGLQHALGPVDELAGLEPLLQVGDLGLERDDLGVPATARSRWPAPGRSLVNGLTR